MMAHVNVQVRLQKAAAPADAVPADTYLEDRRRKFHNGDAIEFFHQPNAVTDGDSLIHFRRADVIAAGDIFTTTQYPSSTRQRRVGRASAPGEPSPAAAWGRSRHGHRPATATSPTSTKSSSTAIWWSSSGIGSGP